MKGTFIYDEKTCKLTLKRDDGERVGALNITLAGDAESTVIGAQQYEHVQLWLADNGDCLLATADRAPCDRQINLGKWCAYALAMFVPLSKLIQRIELYCRQIFRRLNGKALPLGNYGGYQKKYQYPPKRGFASEFMFYWKYLRRHALWGLYYACFAIGGLIVSFLL